MNLLVLFALFIAFTIGLNLGLHGIINLHDKNSHHALKKDSNIISSELESIGDPKSTEVPILVETIRETPYSSKEEQQLNKNLIKLSLIDRFKLVESAVNKYIVSNEGSNAKNSIQSLTSDIPILLLTCNRPEQLQNTLKSLMKVKGVKKDNILVSQDGAMNEVKAVVDNENLLLLQNLEGIRLRGGAAMDGAERIARHYKFSLSAAFQKFPKASSIIIVEDDLLFSPDFYEYFNFVSKVLQNDESLFVVSAWNDNGFKGKVNDMFALRRTEFFPGLGWLLTRNLYKTELESKWPNAHWDHWLRSPEIHKNRETVYPQVPRTFHNGIKGTFMNLETHNRYFRDIDYNTNEQVSWIDSSNSSPVDLFLQANNNNYEYRIQELVKQCKHINQLTELINMSDEIICIWINVNPEPSDFGPPDFQPIANFFGIWHEHKRGGHKGLHEFYFGNNYILLLNLHISHNMVESRKPYSSLVPTGSRIIKTHEFNYNIRNQIKVK